MSVRLLRHAVFLLRHAVFAVAMLSVAIGVRAAESVNLAVITPLSGPFGCRGKMPLSNSAALPI